MEQPCYKCGQTVEQGVPFCPHCAAPQIRVVIAEPKPAPAAFAESSVTSQGAAVLPASQTVPVLALPMQWSQAVRPCALAALIASILMSLGLYPLVAMVSAGFLAVVFYRQRRPGSSVRARAGARIGVLGGVLFFGMTALLVALAVAVPDLRTKVRDQFLENARKWVASRPPDPQMQAVLDQLKTPEGLITALIAGVILLLVLSIALGGLGGALGGAILGRRDKT